MPVLELHRKPYPATHHEKWDGSGYPEGLEGKEIPIIGRIMAVADVYDALTTKRVYKEPISHNEEVSIIVSERSNHFAPEVVDALLELQDEFINVQKFFPD